jgi:hypothetical protein
MVKEKSPQTKSAAEAAYKGAFGFKPSERIEQLVLKQYFKLNQTPEEIIEGTDIALEDVLKIIEKYKSRNQ